MACTCAFLTALLLASFAPITDAVKMRGAAPKVQNGMSPIKVSSEQRCSYKKDALVQLASGKMTFTGVAHLPGTGVSPEETQAELKAGANYKDGFYSVGCIKDYMYYKGDKFGDNKYDYELEKTANVSIVFPLSYVAKEDRKPMTIEYCYSLCRQLKNTFFFGIVNGRNCYCAPYIKPMTGDDSVCTAKCDGDKGELCGSTSKSSVFQMHLCDDTVTQLAASVSSAGDLINKMILLSDDLAFVAGVIDGRADKLKLAFGKVGDPAVSDLFQAVEGPGRSLATWGKSLSALAATMSSTKTAASALTAKDFKIAANAHDADSISATMAQEATTAKKYLEQATSAKVSVWPTAAASNASKQYYPIMYFVDKKFQETPTSCSGSLIASYVGTSKDGCATMCDKAETQGCIGFLFVPGKTVYLDQKDSFCFVFSGITSIQYYTKDDCTASEVMCYGKLSKLAGTSPLDKKRGQKEIKADRCMPVTV